MSTITLFQGIPWNSNPMHVLRFPDVASQTRFFDSWTPQMEFPDVNYDPRVGAVLSLNIDFISASDYNYLRWEDGDKTLYFFIENIELLNDDTTNFQISEDIWQTTHLNMKILPGRVHRRHMPRWNGSTPIIYPVDEGNPRSFNVDRIQRIPGESGFVIVVSKSFFVEGRDEIDSVVTFANVNSPEGRWLDPTNDIGLSKLASVFKIPLSSVVGIYATPWVPKAVRSGNTISLTGAPIYINKVDEETEITYTVAAASNVGNFQTVDLSGMVTTTKPSGNPLASINYEPQAWSDNAARITVTDTYGNPVINIPQDIFMSNPSVVVYAELESISPQIRIMWGAYPSTVESYAAAGLSCVIPCAPIGFANSNYLDYTVISQDAERQILNNNIRANIASNLVSGFTGSIIGGAIAEGTTGAGAAGIGIAGSLINTAISAKADYDNFALNEQKLRNSVTPPVGGMNLANQAREGVKIVRLVGDSVSRNIIWKNYQYYGVIVDQSMEINLRTRKYYDFIQTANASIIGDMFEGKRAYLADMFNRGVTVWHYENYRGIGDYTYDNTEI